jgi:erythromycin esterase-like protein
MRCVKTSVEDYITLHPSLNLDSRRVSARVFERKDLQYDIERAKAWIWKNILTEVADLFNWLRV